MQRVIISIALVRWSWSCARYGGEASEEPGPSTGRSPKARNGTGLRHGPRVSARCRGACEGAERRLREGEERLGEGSGRGQWTLGKTSEPSVRRTARTRETACGQRRDGQMGTGREAGRLGGREPEGARAGRGRWSRCGVAMSAYTEKHPRFCTPAAHPRPLATAAGRAVLIFPYIPNVVIPHLPRPPFLPRAPRVPSSVPVPVPVLVHLNSSLPNTYLPKLVFAAILPPCTARATSYHARSLLDPPCYCLRPASPPAGGRG